MVRKAIKIAGNTMPGPDQIPYKAWKRLGELAVTTLHDAILELSSSNALEALCTAYEIEGDVASHSFNKSTLCCLPKKKTGTDGDMGDYYEASATRPLCIVNTDNRLIASAARLVWEPIFNKWVSDIQRGFLKGRSMLGNVIDIDFEAMKISLIQKNGALILFDFKAAFPSESHEYMFAVLRHIGVPEKAINLIETLYDKNKCNIACKGGTFEAPCKSS